MPQYFTDYDGPKPWNRTTRTIAFDNPELPAALRDLARYCENFTADIDICGINYEKNYEHQYHIITLTYAEPTKPARITPLPTSYTLEHHHPH